MFADSPSVLNSRTVVVLPRLDAEALLHTSQSVCISITNPRQHVANLVGWHDVLRLGYHDTTDPHGPHQVFSAEQAKVLLAFVRAHRRRALCVHCEHGVSRSYATGLFLADWLYRDLVGPSEGVPNEWVLQELRHAARRLAWRWRDLALLRTSWRKTSKLLEDVTLEHLHRL